MNGKCLLIPLYASNVQTTILGFKKKKIREKTGLWTHAVQNMTEKERGIDAEEGRPIQIKGERIEKQRIEIIKEYIFTRQIQNKNQ